MGLSLLSQEFGQRPKYWKNWYVKTIGADHKKWIIKVIEIYHEGSMNVWTKLYCNVIVIFQFFFHMGAFLNCRFCLVYKTGTNIWIISIHDHNKTLKRQNRLNETNILTKFVYNNVDGKKCWNEISYFSYLRSMTLFEDDSDIPFSW